MTMRKVPDSKKNSTDMEAAFARIFATVALTGRWLSKPELIALLSEQLHEGAKPAFAKIRAAAKGSGHIGTVAVHRSGKGSATRYAFGEKPHADLPAQSMKAVADAGANVLLGGIRDFPVPACPEGAGSVEVIHGDNLDIMKGFPAGTFNLIYVDPPFNTGRKQSRTRIRTERHEKGDRVGFQDRRYRTTVVGMSAYDDSFSDYMAFLVPRLVQAYRVLEPDGSLFVHLDYREVHYAKVALDQIFGRDSFINEIIWAYDYGARAKNRWPAKHDNILWYAKDPSRYCFNYDEMERIPYMAPSLVGEEKAARGKTPTDTWWHTIVSPNGKEKTGYPTQKPLGILKRIVRVHSRPGDRLLDFFAGSGSFGEAGASQGRNVTLIDNNAEAIEVMRRRFGNFEATFRVEGSVAAVSSARAVPAQMELALSGSDTDVKDRRG